jgi:SHS2 domain-containing protein
MVYRQLEHTADLALEVVAPDLDRLFAEALVGMCDCVTETATLSSRVRRRLEATAEDRERLLVEWLGEALYLFETEGLLFRSATASVSEGALGWRVSGEAEGEAFAPQRHPWKVAIKGVTYHRLEVAPCPQGWRARVVFDI